jgi:glucose/arabinose dehydrogenase/PKD repeat protein
VPAGFEDLPLANVGFPTGLAFTPDGRLLITTKNGPLRVYANGALRSTPAIDLASRLCTQLEQGLTGVTVGPDFADSHHIYLYYTYDRGTDSCGTDPANLEETGVNRVSRFELGADSVVDPSSERVLIDNIPSPGGFHTGGDIHFGQDGYLYITVGDGGCDYLAPGCTAYNGAAQYPHALVGKILRITSDGAVPQDNPYTGPGTTRCNETGRATPGVWCQEVFASGLRNPYRFAFDEDAPSTRFFINDVGQNSWEEINEGQAGANYGWNIREGFCAAGSTTDCGTAPSGLTNPIFAYGRSDGCTSVTGGAFVPHGLWPAEYDGTYLFGDFVCHKLFRLAESASAYTATEIASDIGGVVAMAFGPPGSADGLYYLTWASPPGLHRIAFTGGANRRPRAVADASPSYGALPLDVSFDASESSDPDGDILTYEWDFGDGSPPDAGATVTHRYETAGTYTATLEATDPAGATDVDTIRIDAGNLPPDPTIDSPAPDVLFAVGEPFTLRGSATDPEDGPLAGSALTWEVLKHHATHTHPFLPPTSGSEASITAPFPEDFASTTNSYLEIRLTATDSKGLGKTISQELRPQLVDLGLMTDPPGLRLEVNGTTAPASVTSWEGWGLELNAPHPQWDSTGTGQTFRSWSDGGAQSHSIVTPGTDTTYLARFTSRYARPKAAKKIHVALVPAYEECLSPNRAHGPPLDRPSCHPPLQVSRYTTVGTPDANGLPAASAGHVQLKALTGNPATPENEADVGIRVQLTDVLDRGADYYVGDVEARIAVRLTDRQNGTSGRDSATTEVLPVSVTARCVPDLAVGGSACAAQTTMNALLPGAVLERRRTIWEVGPIQVFDGGEDADPATPDNGLLATQGVFVP